jgi:hypothetical protein
MEYDKYSPRAYTMSWRRTCYTPAFRRVFSCTALLLVVGAPPAGAQVISATAAPGLSWTAEVATGLLVQPVQGGGSGGALAVTLERATPSATWSPAVLLVAGRMPKNRGNNGYTMDAVGEHPFGPQGPTGWEQKAGLIIDGAGQYRIGRHLSLASRLGLIQQVFTDDVVGPSGALASLGVALDW